MTARRYDTRERHSARFRDFDPRRVQRPDARIEALAPGDDVFVRCNCGRRERIGKREQRDPVARVLAGFHERRLHAGDVVMENTGGSSPGWRG